MTPHRRRHQRYGTLAGALLGAALATWAAPAAAQNTCNTFIAIGYTAAQPLSVPGDVVRVQLTLGSGAIVGGTQVNVSRVRFELDCDAAGPLGLGCPDDGAIVQYQGDASITTTCPGVAFTTGHAVSAAPNQVVFTPSIPIAIPAGTPSFCVLEFDVQILALSDDATPLLIEQVTGFDVTASDALCDNGLASSGTQSGAIPLAPPTTTTSSTTTTTTTTTTSSTTTTTLLSHFQCYEIRPPGTFGAGPLALVDRFGSYTGTLTKAAVLCAPADKNGEDPTAPSLPGHLTSYALASDDHPGPIVGVTVTNQFGTLTLNAIQPARLFVPTAKSLTGTPGPPPGNLDHFTCWQVRRTSGTPAFQPVSGVAVTTQFESVTLTVREPIRLCAPADKNGESPGAESHPAHLLCYEARAGVGFPDVRVFLNNQFGPQTWQLVQRREFCVPSTVEGGASPSGAFLERAMR